MKIIIRKIAIVLLISVVPAIDGLAADKHAPPKPKTKIVCKMVMPKPQPGPWTIINQIPVKVCKEVPVTTTGK